MAIGIGVDFRMQADFQVIRERVLDVTRASPIGERLLDVVLEGDRDDEGADFLRIILQVKSLDGVSDDQMAAVVESIEKVVSDLDERFPSVRFADAA